VSTPHPEHGGDADEAFHLPGPSWWPLTTAIGIALLLTGLVISPITLAVGAVVAILSIGLWVRDARREYRELRD
jgi:hypothetical protein